MSQVKQDIRKFVVDNFLFGQDDGLAEGASFLETGLIDSTGVLELVAHLEKTYAIKVNDDELTPDNLDSINAIAAFVERKRTAASSPA
jgi:acyl carrier protein